MQQTCALILAALLSALAAVGQFPVMLIEQGDAPSISTVDSQSLQEPTENRPVFRALGVLPPPELRNWTPARNQFLLYVNFNGRPIDSLTTPWIDILSDRRESCMFWMKKAGDTLYLFIVPPGYALNDSVQVRNTVDGLGWETPMVILAGTQRAAFWLSYDSGTVALDALQPAAFITPLQLQELPANVLTLQLEGKNRNAKIVRSLVRQLEGRAELVQLDEGFYRNIWFKIKKTVVQNWKTNETKTGTFLAFRRLDGHEDAASQIILKYRANYGAVTH